MGMCARDAIVRNGSGEVAQEGEKFIRMRENARSQVSRMHIVQD